MNAELADLALQNSTAAHEKQASIKPTSTSYSYEHRPFKTYTDLTHASHIKKTHASGGGNKK